MSVDSMQRHQDERADLRAANRRTGFGLLAIVLVFFFGFFASRLIGNPDASIAVWAARCCCTSVSPSGGTCADEGRPGSPRAVQAAPVR